MRSFICRVAPHWPFIRAFLLSLFLHFLLFASNGGGVPVRLVAHAPLQAVLLPGVVQDKRLAKAVIKQDAMPPLLEKAERFAPSERRRATKRQFPPFHEHFKSIATRTPPGELEPVEHEAISADVIRQYRITLAIQMHRHKNYPMLARAQGREGRVEVALQIMSNGLSLVSLAKSSGDVLLDIQAVAMVERGVAVVPLPEGLRGKPLRLILPLQFSLADD